MVFGLQPQEFQLTNLGKKIPIFKDKILVLCLTKNISTKKNCKKALINGLTQFLKEISKILNEVISKVCNIIPSVWSHKISRNIFLLLKKVIAILGSIF